MFTRLKTNIIAVASAALITSSVAAEEVTLPRSMVWTSYDLGAAGYLEASAMAEALDKQYGTRIRLIPSGTAVGRMIPLKTGRAQYGFMSTEIHFAAEAMHEFSAKDWGPQEMRVLAARPSAVGLVAGGDTDFESIYDIKGATVGFVQANPSTTMNTSAALAFAGFTPSDVEQVRYPSYGALSKAFVEGDIDIVPAVPTSSFLREAESGRGVKWLDMPADDKQGWARVKEYATLFSPVRAALGVQLSEETPVTLLGYGYPQLTVTDKANSEDVYNMIKALDMSFDLYKDATKMIGQWELAKSGKTPAGAPFHEGAIKYLKEKGIWTEKDEAWNQARIQRISDVKKAWSDALKEADTKGISDDEWSEFWSSYRAEHLD